MVTLIVFDYIPCFQTHPSGLCNSGDYSEEGGVPLDHGEVYVVKLELPQLDPCKSIYDKVKLLPVCHFSVIFISFSFGTQLVSELQTIVEIVIKYVVLTINSTRSWFFLSRRIHSRCETTKTLCDIDRWTDDYVRAQSEDAKWILSVTCFSNTQRGN